MRRSCLLFVICIERECTYRGILLVKVSGNLSGRRNSFFFSKYFELYQDVKLGAVEIQLAERSLPTSEHLGSNPIKNFIGQLLSVKCQTDICCYRI